MLVRRPRPTLARFSAEPPGDAARRRGEGRSLSHLLPFAAPPRGGVGAKIKPSSARPAPRLLRRPCRRKTRAGAMVRSEAAFLGHLPPQRPCRRDLGPGQFRGLVLGPKPRKEGPPSRRRGHPALSGRGGAALSARPPTCLRRGNGVAESPRWVSREPPVPQSRGGSCPVPAPLHPAAVSPAV